MPKSIAVKSLSCPSTLIVSTPHCILHGALANKILQAVYNLSFSPSRFALPWLLLFLDWRRHLMRFSISSSLCQPVNISCWSILGKSAPIYHSLILLTTSCSRSHVWGGFKPTDTLSIDPGRWMAPGTYTPMDPVAAAEEAAKRRAKLEAEAASWEDLDGTPKTCPRQSCRRRRRSSRSTPHQRRQVNSTCMYPHPPSQGPSTDRMQCVQ